MFKLQKWWEGFWAHQKAITEKWETKLHSTELGDFTIENIITQLNKDLTTLVNHPVLTSLQTSPKGLLSLPVANAMIVLQACIYISIYTGLYLASHVDRSIVIVNMLMPVFPIAYKVLQTLSKSIMNMTLLMDIRQLKSFIFLATIMTKNIY